MRLRDFSNLAVCPILQLYSTLRVVGELTRWKSPPPAQSHSPTPAHFPANRIPTTLRSSLSRSSQNSSPAASPLPVKIPPPVTRCLLASPVAAVSRSDTRSTDSINRCENAPAAPLHSN